MGSRSHKIGTIYSRTKNLLLKQNGTDFKKPLWYDIYTHFPPDREPLFQRELGNSEQEKVKEIIYPEDFDRAEIYKAVGNNMDPIDLSQNEESQMQKWLKLYRNHIDQGYNKSEALKEIIQLKDDAGQTKIKSENKKKFSY